MPPDAITWLVGTLSVAAMTGCSGIIIAFVRRSPNGTATKGDIAALAHRLEDVYAQLDDRLKWLERR